MVRCQPLRDKPLDSGGAEPYDEEGSNWKQTSQSEELMSVRNQNLLIRKSSSMGDVGP